MQYSENYHMNKPELADQYNLSHWNENTDTIDSAMQDIRSGMDATMKATLLNFCYPIGSIYWSSNSTNPATLFGGTWVQIKDKFVWAKGDSDTVDSTGGAKTVTLTANNLPEHTHKFTPQGTVGEHTHDMNHVHSRGTMDITGKLDPVCTFRANHNDFVATGPFLDSSHHDFYGNQTGGTNSQRIKVDFKASNNWTGQTSNPLEKINDVLTTKNETGGTAPSFTGIQGETANNTTTNVAVDKMPPYVVKYCWERTA